MLSIKEDSSAVTFAARYPFWVSSFGGIVWLCVCEWWWTTTATNKDEGTKPKRKNQRRRQSSSLFFVDNYRVDKPARHLHGRDGFGF